MTQLGQSGALSIAELVFFAPCFFLCAFLCWRHGFSPRFGWLSLLVLSALRVIGSICLLVAVGKQSGTYSLLATYVITSSIGVTLLLLSLTGILRRVDLGKEHGHLPIKGWSAVRLIIIAGLIMYIVSFQLGTETAYDISEAASLLFLAVFLVLSGITVYISGRWRTNASKEKGLAIACVASLPFLAVRLAYSVTVAFGRPGGAFYWTDVSIRVEAFTRFLPEACVVLIYTVAGMTAPIDMSSNSGLVHRHGDAELLAADRTEEDGNGK